MKRFVLVMALSLFAASFLAGAARCEEKSPAYTFKFSGYFKGDVAYDQARVNAGDYALYLLNLNKNAMSSITARETRLGFDFSWKESEWQTDARLEFDFYGLGVTPATLNSQENKGTTMLRHAYVQLTRGHWSLLAGQTSDIISPLVPKSVNYTVLWDQGNIGYRRPQLRLTGWVNATDKVKVTAAVGATRTLGGDLDGDKIDDGADAVIPTVQGRLGMSAKLADKKTLEIGFSGHYGREQYQLKGTQYVKSWSGNVDLRAVLGDRFELLGEAFTGQDLGTYYGGVGQTVNPLNHEIASMGGWGQVSFKPLDRVWINLGYGWDDPKDEDFEIPTTATTDQSFIDLNSDIFGSIFYSVTSTVTAMIEVSGLKTQYILKHFAGGEIVETGMDRSEARVQFAIKAAIK
jgi:hypothetical protein